MFLPSSCTAKSRSKDKGVTIARSHNSQQGPHLERVRPPTDREEETNVLQQLPLLLQQLRPKNKNRKCIKFGFLVLRTPLVERVKW